MQPDRVLILAAFDIYRDKKWRKMDEGKSIHHSKNKYEQFQK